MPCGWMLSPRRRGTYCGSSQLPGARPSAPYGRPLIRTSRFHLHVYTACTTGNAARRSWSIPLQVLISDRPPSPALEPPQAQAAQQRGVTHRPHLPSSGRVHFFSPQQGAFLRLLAIGASLLAHEAVVVEHLVHEAAGGGHQLLGNLVPVVKEVRLLRHLLPHRVLIVGVLVCGPQAKIHTRHGRFTVSRCGFAVVTGDSPSQGADSPSSRAIHRLKVRIRRRHGRFATRKPSQLEATHCSDTTLANTLMIHTSIVTGGVYTRAGEVLGHLGPVDGLEGDGGRGAQLAVISRG
eukprot:1195310-Prorocentrum_minimum.AAC.2